jgi:hypothetical protein
MATVTTISAAPALNGQGVLVKISGAEAITYLSTLEEGTPCTISSSSKVGLVAKVWPYNNYFLVNPLTQAVRFDSSTTPGILASGETITF